MRGLILANKLTETAGFKGAVKILNDAKETLLIFEGVIVVVLIIWQLILMQGKTASVSEEGVSTKNNEKAIKIILICGVVIAIATATIPVILSYFTEG